MKQMMDSSLLLGSIPTYDETSDLHSRSLDWPDADYIAKAEAASNSEDKMRWKVGQTLKNAPGVESLLISGKAEWVVEAVCPDTMHSVLARSPHNPAKPSETVVAIPRGDVGASSVNLWPGVVTVKECSLDPSGTRWGISPIEIGAGRWLVRGAPIRVEHKEGSILVFRPDDSLGEERVSIEVDASGQGARFVVKAAPDRIDALKHGPGLLGVFASALAMLPYQSEFEVETGEDNVLKAAGGNEVHLLANRIRAGDKSLALWDDKANWNPWMAATAVLGLKPLAGDGEA